jgi:uncharacterized membrane protein YGL010W
MGATLSAPGATLFRRELATYARYHRDARNRATHFVGIPAIVFSLLVPLALWRFRLFGTDASAAWVVTALALAGWIALDVAVGLGLAIMMVPMLVIAEWIARSFSVPTAWSLFALFFVGGWVFQLVGHVFEGKRPALVDNLFQAFIGPMFIMAELLMALGLKQDLKSVVEESAATTYQASRSN